MRKLVVNRSLVNHTFISNNKKAFFSFQSSQKFNKFDHLIKRITPVYIKILISYFNHLIEDQNEVLLGN